MEYKIGSLKLKNRVLLAPMLEPNDIAFRLLCKEVGCGLTYTGMTFPLSKKKLNLEDRPALQLFGNSTKGIKSFMMEYDSKVSLWDFNLGCPSKLSKVAKHGAFMLENLSEIENILKVMRENTKRPLTIKIRKSKNSIKIVRLAEKVGVDAICIHARTVSQGYSGNVDYNFALKIKEESNLPIIFSGDVNEENIKDILSDFDFVMVGRSCIGNPNFFAKFCKTEKKVDFWDYLKLAEKYKLQFRQIKYQSMNFTKKHKNGKKARKLLIGAKNIDDIKGIWDSYILSYGKE